MSSLWVLTRGINEYDQAGEYFEAAWNKKPTVEEIMKVVEVDKDYAEHILKGGGRIYPEYCWFYLTEMKSGEIYKHKSE